MGAGIGIASAGFRFQGASFNARLCCFVAIIDAGGVGNNWWTCTVSGAIAIKTIIDESSCLLHKQHAVAKCSLDLVVDTLLEDSSHLFYLV